MAEGIETALEILKDSGAGPRDRPQAAELLTGLAKRRQDRPISIAKFEGDLESDDESHDRAKAFGLGLQFGE